ncbi:hypothetical protein QQX09_10235 [Demequina sp. SYSU T00192]|uniref:Uncharacterized protein n=1 Tax=Demequina litoralis TaxID=3051660 RepID=A0ABT8GAZ8_9MICO|nr:hypothetical protein [Demequina sp. SYSU T00192]MDN4476232.1 hypothetical protein [Demequina sp. SYSU T00192]
MSDAAKVVRTLAPLAEDPAVNALIVDETSEAIGMQIDTDTLVEDLADQEIDSNATPLLAQGNISLGSLLADQAPIAIRSAIATVVDSRALTTVCERSLWLEPK